MCAHPSAKRITVHGRTGPVNAVEADGALFIENDEAEAKAAAKKTKAAEKAKTAPKSGVLAVKETAKKVKPVGVAAPMFAAQLALGAGGGSAW